MVWENKTDGIIQFILEEIAEYCDRIYYDGIDEEEFELDQFDNPFIIMNLETTSYEDFVEVYPVRLEIFGKDKIDVENLTENVRKKLDRAERYKDDMHLRFGKGNRANLSAIEYGIIRRQITYSCRAMSV